MLKPSEMGLHSKVRCEIKLIGENLRDQSRNIAQFAEELYLFIYKYNHNGRMPETAMITQRFARFVSKAFQFASYTDEDVFKFIDRLNDVVRKQRE